MRLRLLLLSIAVAACQRPADHIDVDVMNLTPVPVESAPAQFTRTTFEAPTAPPLSARGTATPGGDPLSVAIHVDLEGATSGDLAVELTTPDGTVYERQTRRIADAPFDVQRFDFTLPVAGTWIETQQLYGEWRAHVLVGARELIAEPFTLNP